MTYIFVAASGTTDRSSGYTGPPRTMNTASAKLVMGGEFGSNEHILFLLSYGTSILTVSLGLVKCLKNGPCRVLGEGGALGGLCSGRFLLLMISVGATLVGKGFYWAIIGLDRSVNVDGILFGISTMFLPG